MGFSMLGAQVLNLTQILGADAYVNKRRLTGFLDQCQFKYGGISKAPGEHPGIARTSSRAHCSDII